MLPTDNTERKKVPVFTAFIKYFPDAIWEVTKVSVEGNEQHNPGEPVHHDPSKSPDEQDSLSRHLLDDAKHPSIGTKAQIAWRAMMDLQRACVEAQLADKREAQDMAEGVHEHVKEPETVNMPAHLEEFLRSEGVLEEYLELYNPRFESDLLASLGEPTNYILGAFEWPDDSVERWAKINDRWLAYLKDLDEEESV